jgi:hypothetical protein
LHLGCICRDADASVELRSREVEEACPEPGMLAEGRENGAFGGDLAPNGRAPETSGDLTADLRGGEDDQQFQ